MAIKDQMESVLSDAQFAAMKARWSAASNGPWFVVGLPWGDGSYVVAGAEDPHVARPVCDCDLVDDYEEGEDDPRRESLANAAFIAGSRTDVIRLLHHAEAAQIVIDAMRTFRDADRDCHASGITDEEREGRFTRASEARREMMRVLRFYEEHRWMPPRAASDRPHAVKGASDASVRTSAAPEGVQSQMVEFDVPGTPVGYTRMTQRSKWQPGPQRYLAYRSTLSAKAKEAMRGNPPMAGAVAVTIMVFVHKCTFDVDNIIKCVLDGLNTIAYRDDKQVRHVEIEIFEAPDSPSSDALTVIVTQRR